MRTAAATTASAKQLAANHVFAVAGMARRPPHLAALTSASRRLTWGLGSKGTPAQHSSCAHCDSKLSYRWHHM